MADANHQDCAHRQAELVAHAVKFGILLIA
jgi:hypothetical protein